MKTTEIEGRKIENKAIEIAGRKIPRTKTIEIAEENLGGNWELRQLKSRDEKFRNEGS